MFALGNGSGFSVREVIAVARKVTGIEVPTRESARRPGDPAEARRRERPDPLGARLEGAQAQLEAMGADAWAFGTAHPRGYSE